MIRLFSILIGLFFSVVLLWSIGVGIVNFEFTKHPEAAFHKEPKDVAWSSEGAFGHFDRQQVQRGYQVYKEVCSACHSLRLVAFRNLAELGYTEAEVKAEAAAWQVPGIDPVTGENTTRPGLPTDYFPKPYPNDIAAASANNNAIPPDLSLITKARHHGSDYVYSLLTGYETPPANLPEALQPGPGLHYNPYFKNLNLAMAQPLVVDNQVTYADGTAATVDQMSRDVVSFLRWTAEPTIEKRKQTGWPVIGFLIFATILGFFSYKQIWAGKKRKKKTA